MMEDVGASAAPGQGPGNREGHLHNITDGNGKDYAFLIRPYMDNAVRKRKFDNKKKRDFAW
ncbi:MAG: hypothetical protein ACMUIL_02840 [bacterium]